MLAIGASGIRAFNTALATVAENVSNAQSTGYTRRTVTIVEQATTNDSTTGNMNGARVASITRTWDAYRASAKQSAQSDAASASTRLDWMKKAESALSDDGSGVGQSATAIFTAGDTLASNPGETGNRKAFLAAIQQSATAFNTTASQLATAASDVGQSAISVVASVNATLNSLDSVNSALHAVQSGTVSQANLLDQRDRLLDDLSTNVPIEAKFAADGSATVTIAGGGVTLANMGGPGARLSVTSTTGTVPGRLSVVAVDQTGVQPVAVTSGALGGLIASAENIAERREELDALAQTFATQLNAWSAQGTDSAGAAGGALLTGTTAATLTLAVTDPAKVPAASGGAANGNLLALAALRGDAGVEARWNGLVTDQGRTVDATLTESTATTSRAESTASALADATAVDADTEAAELVKWQQAYSGAAKVIQVAKETMQSILDII